jgi:hypothetical protein
LLWHLNLTLMEKAIDCAKFLVQPFTDGRLHQVDFIPNRQVNVILYNLGGRVLKGFVLTTVSSYMVTTVGTGHLKVPTMP